MRFRVGSADVRQPRPIGPRLCRTAADTKSKRLLMSTILAIIVKESAIRRTMLSDDTGSDGRVQGAESDDAPFKDSKAARRIRDAAAEAFAESGYGGTTTRDIAARLGLSPAAMYPHYRSKEELLYAISYEGHRRCVDLLTANDQVAADPATRLRSVVGAFAAWHGTHHARGRVIQYELTALSPEHYRMIVGLRRQSTQVVRRIIDAGAGDGTFDVPDAEGVTLAITSLCVDICRWFPAGRYTEPDQLRRLYGELALRLAGAQAAHPDRPQSPVNAE